MEPEPTPEKVAQAEAAAKKQRVIPCPECKAKFYIPKSYPSGVKVSFCCKCGYSSDPKIVGMRHNNTKPWKQNFAVSKKKVGMMKGAE